MLNTERLTKVYEWLWIINRLVAGWLNKLWKNYWRTMNAIRSNRVTIAMRAGVTIKVLNLLHKSETIFKLDKTLKGHEHELHSTFPNNPEQPKLSSNPFIRWLIDLSPSKFEVEYYRFLSIDVLRISISFLRSKISAWLTRAPQRLPSSVCSSSALKKFNEKI